MEKLELNLEGMRSFAEVFATKLRAGDVVGLEGELGAGKTSFVGMVLQSLDYKLPVSSPSYVLEHIYVVNSSLRVSHWDLYRCGDTPLELLEPCGYDELRFIEWPSKAVASIDIDVQLNFSYVEDSPQQRSLQLTGQELDRFADCLESA